MERLTVKWTDKVYDTFDPVDVVDNEYSKANYNKILTKLGEYEDLEEQGRLIKLPCRRCDRKVSENDDTKNKVTSLEIIVRMIDNKPYYEIKYKKVGEYYYHVGYSSFNIDNVLKWRDECFELVESDREERS